MTKTRVQIDHSGRFATFHHRDTLRARIARGKAELPGAVPATSLPIDCTGNGAVRAPMDGNADYGDCMVATAAHVDNIWTFGRGEPGWTESTFPVGALENQYLAASGGDNGLDEPTLLDQVWKPGIAGDAAATYDDALDIDVTDVALARFCIDRFSHVCMMWSVPDTFIREFHPGQTWAGPATPNPANGHGTPLSDVSAQGHYRLFTWGAWVWVSPEFVASVDPACWVTFSRRQFNAAGYDARGRHVQEIAAAWIAIGGSKRAAAAVVAMFPAPGPAPAPAPTSPACTLAEVKAMLREGWPKGQRSIAKSCGLPEVEALLTKRWPK